MSDHTKIEWTDATWNPVTGCTPVSPGCEHCYARRMALRLQAMGVDKYVNGFLPSLHPDELTRPDHWRKPRRVFVCSMGDLFHPDISEWWIGKIFETMRRNQRHIFQILTKRPERALAMYGRAEIPELPNVWLGVSVENGDATRRVLQICQIPAAGHFVSFEPLLRCVPTFTETPLLTMVDWVIVGGETGPGARRMPEGEPQRIRDICVERGIPFFFKQWGDAYPGRGRTLDGRLWEQIPGD